MDTYLKDLQPFQPGYKITTNRKRKNQEETGLHIYQYLHEFTDKSSIHGCKHLSTLGRHCTEYLLWGAVLIAALGMTLYIANSAWVRYNHYPTVIVMEKNSKDWNITFPTAFICPEKKVDEDLLQELARNYNAANVSKFVKFFTKLSQATIETYNELPNYREINPKDFLEIIIEASYNFSSEVSSTLTNEREDLDPVYTELGICYSYNSKIAPFFNPKSLIGKEPQAERSQELHYCNMMDGDSFASVTRYEVGYNFTVAGPYELPIFGSTLIEGTVMRILEMDLGCVAIVSSEEVRELDVEQRNCRTRSDGSLRVSRIYSYNLCRMECRIDLALSLCGCIPYLYVNEAARIKDEHHKICDVDGMKCLAKNGTLLMDLRDPVTRRRHPCHCLPLCTDFHFLVQNIDKWEGQGSRIKWQVRSYPRTRYRRTIIFGFSDLMVSVGATAGLFLGCSVLSFVELIYFFTLRPLCKLWANKEKESVAIKPKLARFQRFRLNDFVN